MIVVEKVRRAMSREAMAVSRVRSRAATAATAAVVLTSARAHMTAARS